MAPAGKRKAPSFKVADKREAKKAAKHEESDEDRFAMSSDESSESSAESGQEEEEEEHEDMSAERASKQETHPSKDKVSKVTGAERSLLFKTNLFKLQIEELLQESRVQASSKATRGLDAALRQLRDVVVGLDSVPEQSVDAAVNYVYNQSKRVMADGRGIDVPFPDPAPPVGMAMKLGFAAPQAVHVGFNVDVAVQMPSELLQERDYVNMRYVYKRAFYVAVLLIGIRQSALGELFEVGLGRLHGDVRQPVVELRAKAGVKQMGKLGCVIRVIPTFGHDAMALKRLTPERNPRTPDAADASLPATPQYNAVVLGDALLMCPDQRNGVGRTVGNVPVCGSERVSGFSGGRAGPKLAGTMSGYQLSLLGHDFSETPVQFGTDADLSVFAEHYSGVFRTAYDLNSNGADRFAAVFLSAASCDLAGKYDHVFRVTVDLSNWMQARRLRELEWGSPAAAVQHRLASFLGEAMAKQARDATKAMRSQTFFIGVVADANEARRLVDLGPSPDSDAGCGRARAELRRFRDGSIRLATVWGGSGMSFEKRAQIVPRMVAYLLRRHFGVQAAGPEILQAEDLAVVDKNRPKNAVAGEATLFSLSTGLGRFMQSRDDDDGVATFEAATTAFDALQKELKELEDELPLRVLQLHAVSPGLRYTSVVPPKRVDSDDSYIEPQHVLVEFESSSKWPDDLTALHKIKAAFLMRLSECYTGRHPEATVQVGNRFLGYGASDGLMTGMAALHCEREGSVLAQKASEMRGAKLTARADALELAHRRWTRNHVWRAAHHRRMLDLSQRHHPALSMTVRLLKRWLARHMLLGQAVGMAEEVAELVAARAFTDVSDGLQPPATGSAGFVRCLRVLATWAWGCRSADHRENTDEDDDEEPALKPLAQGVWVPAGMGAEETAALQHEFEAKKFRAGWRVATQDDPSGSWFGQGSAVLARRIAALAKASLACVRQALATGDPAQLAMAFTTPLSDYDFVIRLDKDMVSRRFEQPPRDGVKEEKEEVFKNLKPAEPAVHVHANPFNQPGMVGFDPVAEYVRDLVNVYHRSALFFHDVYGGHVIAGLWNPAAAQPAVLNPRAHANAMPVDRKQGLVGLNKDAVMAEIIRLGEGLVADVVLQQD
ncbi:hypothetical protein DL89DRAFT_264534 [Linderina pennispora]|uniref:U3 small nucleolar RNA-associated protein 22 n=1 Tax=Linderina pennispora TaxID=61395 RepID=A0A1Y1WMI1_9FUNG|nr:uncharacterized protein DL89DRAFT_264534 [Linderina pennispora]ORX74723.1 hypothetical protein DL89DRAFT_264534 [Linderina pennispora]